MGNFIKGNQLMLFIGGKSIAFATSHTLTLSADTSDVKTKDHGLWGSSEITGLNWEITSENLYTEGAADTLFTAWNAGTQLDVAFGLASNWTSNGLANPGTDNYTPAAGVQTGKAIITNLSYNAAAGENATLSVTLKGVGTFGAANGAHE